MHVCDRALRLPRDVVESALERFKTHLETAVQPAEGEPTGGLD